MKHGFQESDAVQPAGWLRSAVLMLAITVPAFAQDEEETEFLKLEDMPLPTFQELMDAYTSGDEFDWVVTGNDDVIVTEPIYPRPDPLGAKTKRRQQLIDKKRKTPEERTELTGLNRIELQLKGEGFTDYELSFSQVKEIRSFQMLILNQIDELLKEGDIRKAYELLMVVERQAPGWERAVPFFEKLLLREAELKTQAGDIPAALALLDELAARNIENPELPKMLARLLDDQIKGAADDENYPRARYYIGRFARHFPDHEVVQKWTTKLTAMMTARLGEAQQLSRDGKTAMAADIAREAARIWRPVGGQFNEYAQLASRYQKIRIPVDHFSEDDVISPVPLAADRRHEELTLVPLFEPVRVGDVTYFDSSFFEVWDPQDLGREVVFTIRQRRPHWHSQPILSANQIADELGVQLIEGSSSFNPRLASFVREFSVRSPTQLQVSFNRVPLFLEGLMRFTITDTNGVLSTRFKMEEHSPERRVYRRVIPEPNGLNVKLYHVAEIEEVKFASREEEIRAFNRGQLEMIPHLRPWEIDIFRKFKSRFAVQKYAIPQNHILVFNPDSETVRNTYLRRGLSFGVDRENLLKKILLRDEDMTYGRPASAPWHAGSYASSPLVEPPRYDHYLSFLLRVAAQEQLRVPDKQAFIAKAKEAWLAEDKEWDEETWRVEHADEIKAAVAHIKLPKLKMLYEPGPMVELAVEKMLERWEMLGYEIEAIPANQKGETPDDWDFMYRVVQMEEPLLDLWSVLLTDNQFDVSKLDGYPDWLRQELINLDYSTSFLEAQERLHIIHRHMTAQAFIIPLWELDDFMVFPRQRLKNFIGRPISTYHGVERWTLLP